ncbi:DUF6247 family protein [Streptomyces sp. NPDC048550]|uniref:DUF6247 family protein n=1 Tax=Streptomyces sp. NPDC048550 TaxID=3155739 RepID=UPI00342DC65C
MRDAEAQHRQPASTPEGLRSALALLAPETPATFDAERAIALQQAREQVSAAPMRRFVGQWAVYVAVERHPERAARLHELEARATRAADLSEARAASRPSPTCEPVTLKTTPRTARATTCQSGR